MICLVSGKKSGGKVDWMRKMHAPMGPNQAVQHLEFSEEFTKSSRGDEIHTIQIHTKTDSMPFADKFDVRERWDIVDIAGRACQVRMTTRTIWSVRFHMFMSLVNSLATKGAEKYANNMIKVMTERGLLMKQTMPKP